MKAPSVPENEADRLADLYEFGILDTPAERVLDEIAALAAIVCGTKHAAVSLIDRDRQWFKATHNLALKQTTREESICGHAILEREIFEVPDVKADPRFADNPILDDPAAPVRFYGGGQLSTERGHVIGMLCVMDPRPRALDENQRQALRQLADVAMAVIDAGRKTRLLSWFGTLLDNVRDEILILDPDSLLYLHANRAAQEHLGYTLEEMRRLTVLDITPDADPAGFHARVAQLRSGEPYVVFQAERKRANGQHYEVESRWQLITTNGKPVILSIVQDITERRKIERMKDEFTSVINHELRTPLTSIHGAIKLLEQGAAGPLPAQAKYLVELAAHNTQRLREIVDDILDLEKISSGQMQFELEPLRAREVLERVAAGYSPAAQTAGVVIEVAAEPHLMMRADARRLQQVLANLVSNAIKFAPRETAVTLSAQVSPERPECVRLEVLDRGPGVPPEFRSRIFQRFAQADMKTNRSKGGSGLGLSIARQMTQQMGGTAGYASQPGETRFYVDLPKEQE